MLELDDILDGRLRIQGDHAISAYLEKGTQGKFATEVTVQHPVQHSSSK